MLQKMDFNYGSEVDVEISPELNRQKELAIHGLAVILAHNELRRVESDKKKFTLLFISSHDAYLKRETNRCLTKMICAFGQQSINTLFAIAMSFEPIRNGEAEARIENLVAEQKNKLLVSILGEDKYKELFSED